MSFSTSLSPILFLLLLLPVTLARFHPGYPLDSQNNYDQHPQLSRQQSEYFPPSIPADMYTAHSAQEVTRENARSASASMDQVPTFNWQDGSSPLSSAAQMPSVDGSQHPYYPGDSSVPYHPSVNREAVRHYAAGAERIPPVSQEQEEEEKYWRAAFEENRLSEGREHYLYYPSASSAGNTAAAESSPFVAHQAAPSHMRVEEAAVRPPEFAQASSGYRSSVDGRGQHGRLDIPYVEHKESFQHLNCSGGTVIVRGLCKVAQNFINQQLQKMGITIKSGDLMFNYHSDKKYLVPGGSCQTNAQVQNIHVNAAFKTEQPLNLQGDSMKAPLLVPYKLPVAVAAKIGARQRFGIWLPFSRRCKTYASHLFALNGGVETTADLIVGFSANPSFTQVNGGDYEIRIKPQAIVMFELENTNLKFHVSGVRLLGRIWGAVVGFVHSPALLFKSVGSIFKGETLHKVFGDLLAGTAWHLGSPLLLGAGLLPDKLESAMYSFFANPVERKAEKVLNGLDDDVEDKINALIKTSLKLDKDGAMTYTINKHIVNAMKLFGVDFVADKLMGIFLGSKEMVMDE